MSDKEIEALWKDAAIPREEAQKILDDPLGYCETLAAEVKKDSPRMLTKFLKRQNGQLSKIFKNEHKD